MNKLRFPAILLILFSICFWAVKGQAEDKKSSSGIQDNIPIQIKIVLNENGKENKSYLFDFNATPGQEVTYKGEVKIPYFVPTENEKVAQELRFIALTSDFAITPLKNEMNLLINSKISMSFDLAAADKNIPVVSHFEYAGVSFHKGAIFLKVFSGPLMDLAHSIEIYIKAGK